MTGPKVNTPRDDLCKFSERLYQINNMNDLAFGWEQQEIEFRLALPSGFSDLRWQRASGRAEWNTRVQTPICLGQMELSTEYASAIHT